MDRNHIHNGNFGINVTAVFIGRLKYTKKSADIGNSAVD